MSTEVFAKVRTVLVEALNVEEVEVTPNSTLQGDLGAESIDLLDISFRLEREFNIKIEQNRLFPTGVFNADPECVADGKVTEKGLTKLREAVPHVDFTEFAKNPEVGRIADTFTVQSLVNFVTAAR